MKKILLTVIAMLLSMSVFAQKKYDAKEIMGWTQEQVIKTFGKPSDIAEAKGSSINYDFIYPGIEPFNNTVYLYNDFTIAFANFFTAEKTEFGYKKQSKALYVIGVSLSKNCTAIKLPDNLTTNDTMEDVLDIYGSPYMQFDGLVIYHYKKTRISPEEIGLGFFKDVQRIDIEPSAQFFFEDNRFYYVLYGEEYTLK